MTEHHRPAVRMPLPATVPCDQCSGSMHRRERLFVCERCGRSLTVATVSKAWMTIRDTYGIDISDGENDLLILAAVLALDLAEDRERARDD